MSDAIVRDQQPGRCVVVTDTVTDDHGLSFSALGLLIYILNRPAGWTASPQTLAGLRANAGRDTIYRLLGEMRAAGYARPKRRYTGAVDWHISAEPHPDIQDVANNAIKSTTCEPHPDIQDGANRAAKSTTYYPHPDIQDVAFVDFEEKETKKEEKKKKEKESNIKKKKEENKEEKNKEKEPPPFVPPRKKWEPPDFINLAAWNEFEEHRRAMRKPLTDQARRKNANILVGLTPAEQQAAIDTSIANGWRGIFRSRTHAADERRVTPHQRVCRDIIAGAGLPESQQDFLASGGDLQSEMDKPSF